MIKQSKEKCNLFWEGVRKAILRESLAKITERVTPLGDIFAYLFDNKNELQKTTDSGEFDETDDHIKSLPRGAL